MHALAARHRVGELAQRGRSLRIAGPDHQQPAGGRDRDRGLAAPGQRDLAQRVLQIVRERKIAGCQRRRAGRVERHSFLGQELRIGKEELLAIDAISAQLALVEPARLQVFDRHTELQQLRLVALQLALGGGAGPAVLLGKQLAELGERDGLARIEQGLGEDGAFEVQMKLDLGQVAQPGGEIELGFGTTGHEDSVAAGAGSSPSRVHWMAATLSLGISTFFPASGPSSVPITK